MTHLYNLYLVGLKTNTSFVGYLYILINIVPGMYRLSFGLVAKTADYVYNILLL